MIFKKINQFTGIQKINQGIGVANGLPEDMYPKINFKSTVTPLVNNNALVAKVNAALANVIDDASILKNVPSVMGSEDFQHLVKADSKTVYDYIQVGTANPEAYQKAIAQGKKAPYFNHNGNYQVDLAAIPLGTVIGAVALIELFRK